MRIYFFFSGLALFLTATFGMTQVASAAAWPTSQSATALYSSSTVEPSGIVWHPQVGRLFFVGDEGQVVKMTVDGTVEATWTPGGDLEGITIADPESNYVYLALEKPNDSILEFDISSGQLTGRSWDMSSYLISGVDKDHQDANLGLEALTFVPNGKHPYTNSNSGGVFYGGLQYDGKIYVFDINLASSGVFSYLGSITPVAGRSGISDTYYSLNTNTLYALFGATLREMRPNGEYIAEFSVPGTRQEGFTLIESACPATGATAVVAEDTPGSVKAYSAYPVNTSALEYIFYTDADGDGLGSDNSTTLCSSAAPAGYVSNSNDLNDSDYDNDGVSTGLDCNDLDVSISVLQTYYLDADADGFGSDNASSMCTYTSPSGYVTNSDDLNDSDYDNDGVSTTSDCNDADATQTTGNLFYQDLDSDGMGSSLTSLVCSSTAPSGYVSNSNESSDANDSVPNAGIEISGDERDNDGDGEVDEFNYVATNGLHPYYSTLDPNSTSFAASSLLRVSGATNGYIKVKYADNSIYRYRVFTQITNRNTKVRQVNSTANLLVTAANGLKTYVNGYTGERVSTSSVKR